MLYSMPCLQFGDNQKRVPGFLPDTYGITPEAPVKAKLIDKADQLWGLVFSYVAGTFYTAGATVFGQDGAVVNSWYSPIGGPPTDGPNSLTLMPFVDGQFSQVANFVEFSEPATTANSINTDTITQPSVTATVKLELPGKIDVSMHSGSHSITITSTITRIIFDHIFVIYGDSVPIGNGITVPKGQGCLALAVYKSETTTGTVVKEFWDLPQLNENDWPQLYAEAVKGIAVRGIGEVFEHLSPRVLAELDSEALKLGMGHISSRIEQLNTIMSMIAGLAERRRG